MDNKLFQYLGCSVMILVALYIIISLFKYQVVMLEGFHTSGEASDSTVLAEEIKKKTTLMLDSLLIDKYRTNYEDVLINYHEYLNAMTLHLVTTNSMETLDKLPNKLGPIRLAREAINDTMKYLDSI